MSNRRRAVTRRDVLSAVVFLALLAGLLAILMPSRSGPRELSKRSWCSANLGGTGKGFATYATSNNDWWPIPAHKVPAATQPSGEVTYVRRIGAKRGAQGRPEAGATTDQSTEVS